MDSDLLANIFSRLALVQRFYVIPLVCKPWKLASLNPFSWKSLDFSGLPVNRQKLLKRLLPLSRGRVLEVCIPCNPDLDCLYLLAHSAPLLQKLHMPMAEADDEWATDAAPLLPCITDLDLSMCRISHLAIEAFGKNCRHITQLRLNSAWWNSFGDNEAFAIAQYYPLLEHLELRSSSMRSAQGVRAILDNCPLLKHLDLAGSPDQCLESSWVLNECRTRLKFFGEPSDVDEDNCWDEDEYCYDDE